jgi:hypothetical protein
MVLTRSQTHENPHLDYVEGQDNSTKSQLIMLLSKRERIVSSLSRVRNWFERNGDASSSAIQVRLRDFANIKVQFDNVQTEIEAIDDQVNELEHENNRQNFEDSYYDLYAALEDAVNKSNSSIAATSRSHTTGDVTNRGPISSLLQLAPIDIKPFSGHYTEWLPFFNTFRALVHDDPRYQNRNLEKLHQLRNCLRGEALEVIQALPISAENYETALSSLRSQFENKRLIVQHHVNNLFNLPQVSKDSARSLRLLVNTVNTNLDALNSLDINTTSWDPLLIHIITSRLDSLSRHKWEESLKTTEPPSKAQLITHLTQRCNLLEALEINKNLSKTVPTTRDNDQKAGNKNSTKSFAVQDNKVNFSCYFCEKSHSLYNCPGFLRLHIADRESQVKRMKLCKNCLRPSHEAKDCKSASCKLCHQKHNTLLHPYVPTRVTTEPQPSVINCNQSKTQSEVLLSTVIVNVRDRFGNLQPCRALLDAGSQSNFILQSTCKRLGLATSYKEKLHCLVSKTITQNIPSNSFSKKDVGIPKNIRLADEEFNVSRPIDLLIGAEIFWKTLCVGQIKAESTGPIFQKTVFGWIIGGPSTISDSDRHKNILCNMNANASAALEKQVEKFWLLEGYNDSNKPRTKIEKFHENNFEENVTRTKDGRFQVRLTFNDKLSKLGTSLKIAEKRFMALERNFSKIPEVKLYYGQFMNEYIHLGHMTLTGTIQNVIDDSSRCFLPHHAVFKSDGNADKIRVVFDGSARTSTGVSLNETLDAGPKILNDIFPILIKFRTFKYAFSADICKMYRQILIHPDDRRYQQILWRDDPAKPLGVYELNTVTYGLTSSPYAAIKCIKMLADAECQKHSKISETIHEDFYVDDVLTGANTLQETIQLRNDLVTILKRGCFGLSKWASNSPEILLDNTAGDSLVPLERKTTESKTLGLLWDTNRDCFRYSSHLPATKKVTKRSILSISSQIFDPLGLLSPVTVKAKMLMQELWSLKLGWDESVPTVLHSTWNEWRQELHLINQFEIPRYIFNHPSVTTEVHGFADASEKAYGGVIYIRTIQSDGKISVNILCAKSRAAPLKVTQLPRLELCAALLVSQLYKVIIKALKIDVSNTFFWTDSTISLAWIAAKSSSLKTFVSNRVAEIQELTDNCNWGYVPSASNPADIISRGSSAGQLVKNDMYWHGPTFLKCDERFWPKVPKTIPSGDAIPERKTRCLAVALPAKWDLLSKFSEFNKLCRILAWILRFKHNTVAKLTKKQDGIHHGCLSCVELNDARKIIIRLVQESAFPDEINALKSNKSLKSNSKLLTLNAYIDKDGIICVGGRLNKNSLIRETQKHPYVIPKDHHVTQLIIRHYHNQNLHSGAQATLAAIRQQFWVLNGRSAVRQVIRKCVPCFRVKPTSSKQIMGDLPSYRIEPSRVFEHTGLDYCGPIKINLNRGRGKPKISKAYIGVFICMSSKAVHLELISDCSTESFLSALKRFVSRRGKPRYIHSDNAKTFVGAEAELQQMLKSTKFQTHVVNPLINDNITFCFIPPSAPHMGGLWESAVKSAKHHLKRVAGNALFSFEEMQTLLTQIEACLNSRPLTPLSSDPNDLNPLTPGHFLTGAPLNAIPEQDTTFTATNRLSRWQRVSQAQQHFWKRWSKEYLGHLQHRRKWKRSTPDVTINDLVIIREDNTPPVTWRMGRIIMTHPGTDGHVRVVTIKTAAGVLKRPITKVCVLPANE